MLKISLILKISSIFQPLSISAPRSNRIMALNTGMGLRNAFGNRCDITLKAHADSTKNIESDVTLSALYSSQITPIQTTLRCKALLVIAQYLSCSTDSVTKL
jgi:hypothetical protein